MSKTVYDYIGNLDTLLAVALGAILATSGALIAELIQERLNRRRRERDAARFFGEIISTMDRVLRAALNSQEIGDPWGPVTCRLFRTALREAQIYERNRERLFDIHDMELRRQIHSHMVRKTFPVDAILEYCTDLESIEDTFSATRATMSPEQTARLENRAASMRDALAAAQSAVRNQLEETPGICTELEKIAGVSFAGILEDSEPPAAASNSIAVNQDVTSDSRSVQ